MERYIVDVKTARSRPYMRPVVVRVLDTHAGPTPWHWVRNGTIYQWGVLHKRAGRALDSRYTGPRSAYGQALQHAYEAAAELNGGDHESR